MNVFPYDYQIFNNHYSKYNLKAATTMPGNQIIAKIFRKSVLKDKQKSILNHPSSRQFAQANKPLLEAMNPIYSILLIQL